MHSMVSGTPCPRCGVETRVLVEGLCPRCYAEERLSLSIPESLEAPICRKCGSIRLGGKWRDPVQGFEEAVTSVIEYWMSRYKPSHPVDQAVLESVVFESKPDWTTRVSLTFRGIVSGVQVSWGRTIRVKLTPSTCPRCVTFASGEYDTLLQLRGADPALLERLVYEALASPRLARDVIEVIRSREGVDVYLSHRGAASKLVKALSRRLELEVSGPYREYVGISSTGHRRTRNTIIARVTRLLRE